jgi:hypothetical protein
MSELYSAGKKFKSENHQDLSAWSTPVSPICLRSRQGFVITDFS